MRLAWVKVGGLWPLNTGGRQRTFQILAELSRRHEILVVTTHGAADDPEELRRRLDRCQVVSFPYDVPKYGGRAFIPALVRSWFSHYPVSVRKWAVPAVRRFVAQRLVDGEVDLVVMDFLFAEPNVPRASTAPVVFFSHNVEYAILQRLRDVESRGWRRRLLDLEYRKTRRCERRTIARARRTVAVSDSDRATFLAEVPGASIDVIPTGVDTAYFSPGPTAVVPFRLVFSGSMDWYPNEDAILYFAKEIWPRLRARQPDVSMTIVGRNPSARLIEGARAAGMTVTGTVDDVRPYIDEGSVYVVPLRVGGGTRLKIFEALAMSKAVVSTTIGAEGLTLTPGQHMLIADGPDAFVASVLRLFHDEFLRRRLGAEGRRLMEERYSWPQVTRVFEAALTQAAPAVPAERSQAAPDRSQRPTHARMAPHA